MKPIIITAVNFAYFDNLVKIEQDLLTAAGYSFSTVIISETVADASGKFPFFTAVIHKRKGLKFYQLQVKKLLNRLKK